MTPPAPRQPVGPPSGFDARGAVDLGALAAAREAQEQADKQAQAAREAAIRAAEAAGGDGSADAVAAAEEGVYPGALIVDVDEANFEAEVVNRSLLVPVVIDFWAEWCEPCKSLTPILERLVAEAGGRWVLAKLDVDANQRVAQAFQIQSIPTLIAVVKGQPVPLFQGAQPEAQIRQVMEQLLLMAEQNGVTGRVNGTPGAAPAPADLEPPVAPEIDEATDAIERGDLAAAAAAYQRLLDREPADANARAGLGLVGLLQRTEGVDPQAAVEAAGEALDDPAKTCLAADVLVLARRPEDAFTLLVDTVRRTSGEARDTARAHLLELFAVLGDDDPAVAPARRALAAALF